MRKPQGMECGEGCPVYNEEESVKGRRPFTVKNVVLFCENGATWCKFTSIFQKLQKFYILHPWRGGGTQPLTLDRLLATPLWDGDANCCRTICGCGANAMPVQWSIDWLATTVKVMMSESASSHHSARYVQALPTQPDGVDHDPRLDVSPFSTSCTQTCQTNTLSCENIEKTHLAPHVPPPRAWISHTELNG